MSNALFKIKVDTMRPALQRLLGLAKDTTPIMLAMERAGARAVERQAKG